VDVLDIVLIVVVVAAAIHGLRLGALMQLLTFGGFLVGIGLGLLLAVLIASPIHQGDLRGVVTLLLVLGTAIVFGVGGRVLGGWSHIAVRRRHLGGLDGVLGVVVAVVSVLLSAWLVANLMAQSRYTWLNAQIQQSDVLRAVQRVLPPAPAEIAKVQSFLDDTGFPSVFAQFAPTPAGPVKLPTNSEAQAVGQRYSASMVKVLGQACGYLQEGSGFVVGKGLVVTNAHVVAGESATRIQVGGATYAATPVLFDPGFDLAVLRTSAPLGPSLPLDPTGVGRGTKAVVIGYPEDGPLTVGPAGVASSLTAEGRDIYNQGTVVRNVYQVDADVEPGNSGGPLLTPAGTVIGVVFSRSTVYTGVGYALASPGVLQRVHSAESSVKAVSTQGCTEG
jgi:S1-C subfamily serine protease